MQERIVVNPPKKDFQKETPLKPIVFVSIQPFKFRGGLPG